MSSSVVLDTFAWVEYFRGTKKGKAVDQILKGGANAITPSIVLAELSDIYHRNNNRFWERDLTFIVARTVIKELSLDIAVKAGEIKNTVRKKYKTKFGLADAIILATAKQFGAVLVTGDRHFKNIGRVEYLGD